MKADNSVDFCEARRRKYAHPLLTEVDIDAMWRALPWHLRWRVTVEEKIREWKCHLAKWIAGDDWPDDEE